MRIRRHFCPCSVWLTYKLNMIKCEFCNKEMHPNGKSHRLYCKDNPNRKDISGENNGMFGKKGSNRYTKAKERGEIVEVSEETRERNSKASKLRKHSEETKANMSIIRKKFLLENPDKVPYLLNHSSKESWPEKVFRNALEELNIDGWKQEFRIGLYSIDFAFVEKLIAVEIDGETHNLEKVIQKDRDRNIFMESLGWKVIRFKASDIRKNVYGSVKELEQVLDREIIVTDEMNERAFSRSNKQLSEEEIKRRKEIREFAKNEVNEIRRNEILSRAELLKKLDKTKLGWINPASLIIGISSQKARKWLERNCPEILENAYLRKISRRSRSWPTVPDS